MNITLTNIELSDVEMILNMSFAPLNGFLNEDDYFSVISNCHLTNGQVWPIPIILSIDKNLFDNISIGDYINLQDDYEVIVAQLFVESKYSIDPILECISVAGTDDENHPYIKMVKNRRSNYIIGGSLKKITGINHYNYNDLRLTPIEIKDKFSKYSKIVGFQTRNPIHKSHFELMTRICKNFNAHLFFSPVVGPTQQEDIDPDTRVRCYRQLLKYFDISVTLCVIPLAMRMLGPKEALLHALIRKNYGCTHFIIGRDHAGPSVCHSKTGEKFYAANKAQEFVKKFEQEIGIEIIYSPEIVYVKNRDLYLTVNELTQDDVITNISGTELRLMLKSGNEIPEWFSFPEVIMELRRTASWCNKVGLCVYLIGLSGSGKTSISRSFIEKLKEKIPVKAISLLDGDVIRKNLSKGLGFTKEDRSINVRRIGYVAYEIVKHGGICICSNIAPYEEDRKENRKLISSVGKYIEVFVNTPISICEERDPKGLYAKVRRGEIKNFTGIDDPFEIPTNSEIVITPELSIDEAGNKILEYILEYI